MDEVMHIGVDAEGDASAELPRQTLRQSLRFELAHVAGIERLPYQVMRLNPVVVDEYDGYVATTEQTA